MATKLYFRGAATAEESDYGTGALDARLGGSAHTGWSNSTLTTTAGASLSAPTANALLGPTNGIEVGQSSTGPRVWYSAPLGADVTISGSITWNIWAAESAMTDNVAINGILEVIDGATGTITLIDKTARTTEVAVTTRAVNNFAETPAAGVACKRGDRLRVRIFGDDVGTMAAGGAFTAGVNGATPGADGDSWLELTENLTFVSEPAGTTIYPTNTASTVSTASVDREAWTSRGAGVQTVVTNTVAGYTAPIQITDTAGGTVVDWFTKQLAAFTLGGAVRVNVRKGMSAAAANANPRCEIARVDSDGTNAVVWGATTIGTVAIPTAETAFSFLVSGDDLAISDGQRLRIRFLIDDVGSPLAGPMGAGRTVTLYYAGTSGGASGDTYLTFTQTLTEFTAGTSASAQVATATGSAPGGTDAIVATPAVATTTGLANNPTAVTGISTIAQVATATGAAADTDAAVTPSAQVATATGAAYNASVSTALAVTANVAIGTGAAYDATATTVVATSANAEVATATGAVPVGAGSIKARPVVSTIALRGAASVPAGDPTTGFTVGIDAAVAIGDWLYLAFLSRDHTVGTALPTVTDDDPGPTSWASIYTSGQRQAHVFRKLATGTTAGKTVTVAGCVGSSAGVLKAFSNTIGTTSNLASEGNTSGNETHAGFTATEGGAMHVGLVFNTAAANAVSSLSFATAGATTMTEKLSAGGSDCAVAFGHVLATDSVSGDLTWAQTNAATISLVFAVLPAGPPVGIGVAPDATVTVTSGTSANAEVATATGAAAAAAPSIAPDTDLVTVTGTAITATTHETQPATAGVATASGAAQDVDARVGATTQLAAATGAASNTTAKVTVNVGTAIGTGAALVADGLPGTRALANIATASGAALLADGLPGELAPAGLGAGTGLANGTAAAVAPTTQPASATGVANSATVSTTSTGQVTGQTAIATGAAQGLTAKVAPTLQVASATGAALSPDASLGRTAGVAAGTGAATNTSAKVAVNTGSAAATGTAANATVTTAAAVSATAQVATAQGAAHGATVGAASNVSATAAVAAGTGTAHNARVVVAVAAAAATGTGNAQAAAIAVAVAAYAETATATGAAYNAGVALGAVAALAETAVATGTAYNARVQTAVGSGLDSEPGIRGGIVTLPAIRAGIAASPGPRGGIAVAPGVRGGIVTNRRIRGEVDTT